MCSSSDIRSTVDRYKHLIIYPNCVLENQIFIGTGVQAKNWKIIRDLNITHIVNCSIEHECIFSDALKYLHCRLEDSLEENIYRDLEKACRFIDNALNYGLDDNNSDSDDQDDSRSRNGSGSNQQAKILIHCNLGISRSSSILIAYLIRRYRLCLYSAFNYVKDKRIQTAPNQSFLKQLKHFEDKNVH
jgi:NDP-sugar pyrophosphorylase family protein